MWEATQKDFGGDLSRMVRSLFVHWRDQRESQSQEFDRWKREYEREHGCVLTIQAPRTKSDFDVWAAWQVKQAQKDRVAERLPQLRSDLVATEKKIAEQKNIVAQTRKTLETYRTRKPFADRVPALEQKLRDQETALGQLEDYQGYLKAEMEKLGNV